MRPNLNSVSNLILLSAAVLHETWDQCDQALEELEEISFGGERGLCDGSVAYRAGLCQLKLGRLDAAEASFRGVIDEFPDARDASDYGPLVLFPSASRLAEVYERQGRPQEAADVLERASQHPDAPLSLQLELAHKFETYALPGRAAEALLRGIEAEDEKDRLDERVRIRVELARALARAGRTAEARSPLVAIEDEVRESGSPVDAYQLARGNALAGDTERALIWLERAIEGGYRAFDHMRGDGDLEPLRKHHDYQRLLRDR